ncbi:MAG: hypothetical protein NUV67_04805 [archaeon]|nr:hypothetical protein [archaeon]
MKKFFALLFCLLLAVSGVFALTIKSAQPSYEKGTALEFSGACDSGKTNFIKAEIGGKLIFEQQVNCFEGGTSFVHKYQTDMLDPSGNWEVTLFTENSSTDILVQVEPTPQSAYYRITFLSPAKTSFERSEIVLVSVHVTDSGTDETGAQIVMYDVFGRRLELKDEGSGVYDINYVIPHDAPIGDWGLVVTAKKQESGGIFGGERTISSEIQNANLRIEIQEPTNQTYEQSDSVPIKAMAFYPSGVAVPNERLKSAELTTLNERHALEINSDGELVLAWTPQYSGSQTVTIRAEDLAGNFGSSQASLVISCSVTCFAKQYGLIILVVLLVGAVATRLFYTRAKLSLDLVSAKREREKAMGLIKNLQEEYFSKGVMPASSYKENLASYKARIIELDEKIRELEKKAEEEK